MCLVLMDWRGNKMIRLWKLFTIFKKSTDRICFVSCVFSFDQKKLNNLFRLLCAGPAEVEVLSWSQGALLLTPVNLNVKEMNISIPPLSGPAAAFSCLLIFYECSCTLDELYFHSLILQTQHAKMIDIMWIVMASKSIIYYIPYLFNILIYVWTAARLFSYFYSPYPFSVSERYPYPTVFPFLCICILPDFFGWSAAQADVQMSVIDMYSLTLAVLVSKVVQLNLSWRVCVGERESWIFHPLFILAYIFSEG